MNIRGWFKRRHWEQRMDAEFQFHLETQVKDYIQQGLTREEADRQARRDFGALELAKDECRDQKALQLLDRIMRDTRYAVRSLCNARSYTLAAIATLALGIGANTAIFSALYGVALKPLPYHEPDRLTIVALYNHSLKYPTYLSYPDFLDWQRGARSFEQMAAFKTVGFDLSHPGSPEHVDGYEVSSGFFKTLGVNLVVGHAFSAAEDRPGGMPVAIISHRLWKERFQGSRMVVGKPLTLNGAGYTVAGVLPSTFRFEDPPADVFTAIGRADPVFLNDRTVHDVLCIGRLARGVGLGQAQAEMNTLQEHINEMNPSTEKGQSTSIITLKQEFVGGAADTLLLLSGAVGLVLLIACANVANLLLARAASRSREFALRRALGASAAQVVQQLITESIVLSLAGGLLGLAVARIGIGVVLRAVPGSLPRLENIGINVPVLLFTLGVSCLVGILFGLVPALKQASSDLQAGLKEGGRGSTGSHQRTQSVLVIVQVALALVLLSGAGLLFRTIQNLWAVNPGFNEQHVITFQVGLSPAVTETAERTRAAYRQLTERIREIPGTESADLTALVPLGRGSNSGPFWIGPHQPASMAEIPRATYYPTGPDYPRVMQIPLLKGRFLSQADSIHSQRVCLIDSLLAKTYFAGQDAVGQSVTIPHWGQAGAVAVRIVGVVAHVEQNGLDNSGSAQPQIYYSFYQLPDEGLPIFRNEVVFAVRTRLNEASMLPAVKQAVSGASGDQPVFNIRTMREIVSGSMARQRFPMILLVAFATLALALATVGIYGVVSYSTARRVPEIGIRMALGASKRDVLQMLIGQGLRLAAMGIVIGGFAAVMLTRALSSFSRLLYGVPATDPLTLIAVSVCLLCAAFLACYLPARRAAQLDPMIALRHE